MTHRPICLFFAAFMAASGVWLTSGNARELPELRGPIGFASLDGGTTGGNPKNVCNAEIIANDPNATTRNLLSAVECTQRDPNGGVVTFSPAGATGRITRTIHLPSNITLQGPAKLEDASIRVRGEQNIIIRNLVFTTLPGHSSGKGVPCPDPTAPTTRGTGANGTSGCPIPILIAGSPAGTSPDSAKDSRRIWIDHNAFNRCGDKCIVLTTGPVQASGRFSTTDGVTVSNNVFRNSFLGVLISYQGSVLRPVIDFSTQACERLRDSGKYVLPQMRITVHGNLFSDVHQRSVRASYCTVQVHEFNNAIVGTAYELNRHPEARDCRALAGKGPESVHGARILFEGNYVSSWRYGAPRLNGETCTNDIVQTGQTDPESGVDKLGYIKLIDNYLVNGAVAHELGADKANFPIPYSYSLVPASDVYQRVTSTAGNQLSNAKTAD